MIIGEEGGLKQSQVTVSIECIFQRTKMLLKRTADIYNRKADLLLMKEELLPDCCVGTLFISCLWVQTETSALLDPSLPTVDLGTCLPL